MKTNGKDYEIVMFENWFLFISFEQLFNLGLVEKSACGNISAKLHYAACAFYENFNVKCLVTGPKSVFSFILNR